MTGNNEVQAPAAFSEQFNDNTRSEPSFIRFNSKKMDPKRLASLGAAVAVINENNDRNAAPRAVIQGSRINLNIKDATYLQLAITTLQSTIEQIEQSGRTFTRNSFRTKVWIPALQQASLIQKETKVKVVLPVTESVKPDTYSSEKVDTVLYQGDTIPVNPLRDAIALTKNLSKFNQFMKEKFDTEVHAPAVPVDNYLKLILPAYSNDAKKTAEARERILSYLGLLTTKLKGERNPINIQLAELAFREFSRPKKIAAAPTHKTASIPERISVKIHHVNDVSLRDFANYMAAGRTSCLKLFGEDNKLGFAVKVGGKGSDHHFFADVSFKDGNIDEVALNAARYLIGRLRQVWAKGSTINTDRIRAFLAEEVPALMKRSSVHAGDQLKPIFVEIARDDGRAVHRPRPNAGMTRDTPLPLLVVTSKAPGMFDNTKLGLSIPAINDNNELILKHETLIPTENQSLIMRETDTKDVVIIDGPAGSGKTFWACYMAIKGLEEGKYAKICLAAPAVEAGERLGFMKGDLNEKMNPHINQHLEAMDEIIGKGDALAGKAKREDMMQNGYIEIAPHAFNRGRTFKNTFYILDECQNGSWKQLITAIQRLGKGSTFVFMGDDKQNDRTLRRSAFAYFVDKFTKPDYSGFIGHVTMGKEDIKRHPLLRLIADLGDEEMPFELMAVENPHFQHNVRSEIGRVQDAGRTNGYHLTPSLS